MTRFVLAVLALGALQACDGGWGGDRSMYECPAAGPAADVSWALEPLAPKVKLPLPVAARPDPLQPGLWWILCQAGQILTLEENDEMPDLEVLLDIEDKILFDHPELGLLGFDFHPLYPERPEIYVFYTGPPRSPGTHTRSYLSRFSVDPRERHVGRDSEEVLLEIDFPREFHHGGSVEFGPDGYLYLSVGDGGVRRHGQDEDTLLGSILRINVDHGDPYTIPADNPFAAGGGRPEIFAFGLRNVWKFSFDRGTGDLWAGDVGEMRREEMNLIVRGGNYGWTAFEGTLCFPGREVQCSDPSMIPPILEYDHDVGKAIIGGYVYRGERWPSLHGKLIYADHGTGGVWTYDPDCPSSEPGLLHEQLQLLTSLAEDADGELYVLLRHGWGNFLRLARQPARKP